MPNDELWKDQLAFVSGNILVWGLVLLKVWPLAKEFQIGQHIHFLGRTELTSEVLIYEILALAVAGAACVTAIAVLHIISRGMWLALKKEGALKTALEKLCGRTYNSAILLLIFLSVVILGNFYATVAYFGLKKLLVSYLRVPNGVAVYLVPVVYIFLPIILIFRVIYKKNRDKIEQFLENFRLARLLENKEAVVSWIFYWVVLSISSVFGTVIAEGCYTLDLKTNTVLCDRDRQDIVEVYVTLGGATSAVKEAKLNLINSSTATIVQNLSLRELGEGHYISYVASSTMSEGDYRILLEYPHMSLNTSFPFIRSTSKKSQGFVVIRSSIQPQK